MRKSLQSAKATKDEQQVDPIDESDAHAFRSLFDAHHDAVYNFFKNRGFAAEDCRDLTQETFLAVFTAHEKFRGEARFTTWLYGIMTNVWRRAVRDLNRTKRKADVVSFEDWLEAQTTKGSSERVANVEQPDQQALSNERVRLVRGALEDLPETMRLCLLMRLDQGLRHCEIAVSLQIPTGTVKSLLFQARRKLRDRLAEHFKQRTI